MKSKSLLVFGLATATTVATLSWGGDNMAGKTTVAKYRGDKQAAFSWQFDDSAPSQADFVIPHLNARGLRGTFFVNPGTDRYKLRERTWTEVCPLWDQELANHSLHHQGAKNYKEAQREVGEVSKLIWKLYPHKSRLLPFKSGGATNWKITKAQWAEIQKKYPYFPGGTAIADDLDPSGYDPMPEKAVLFAGMDKVVTQGGWAAFQLHGVGPIGLNEWLPTNGELFDSMLDKLVSEQDKVWTAPEGEVYRYTKERDDLESKVLDQKESNLENYLKLELSTPHLDKALFIEPLTLFTEVPQWWKDVVVKQGETKELCKVQIKDGKSVVMYNAIPNQGPIVLELPLSVKVVENMEKVYIFNPAKPEIAQIRKQVANPLLDSLMPSSLIDLEGDVRGYIYQGKGTAVAALWYWGPKAKTHVTLHDYSEGIHWFLKPDNRHIDLSFIKPSLIQFKDASGKDLEVDKTQAKIPLELSAKPVYLVGKTSRELENLVLYGFLAEAPHY